MIAAVQQLHTQQQNLQEQSQMMHEEQWDEWGCPWAPWLAWGKAASCKGSGKGEWCSQGAAEQVMDFLQPQARQPQQSQQPENKSNAQVEEGLQRLREMGLGHEKLNWELLSAHGGDVSTVAQLLAVDKAADAT